MIETDYLHVTILERNGDCFRLKDDNDVVLYLESCLQIDGIISIDRVFHFWGELISADDEEGAWVLSTIDYINGYLVRQYANPHV